MKVRFRILIFHIFLTILFILSVNIVGEHYQSDAEGFMAAVDIILYTLFLMIQYAWFIPFWGILAFIAHLKSRDELYHGSLMSLEMTVLLILVVITPYNV